MKCDEEFEPDDLIPSYLETMGKLFWLQRPKQGAKKPSGVKKRLAVNDTNSSPAPETDDLEEAKLLARVGRIEHDVLFDKPLAEHLWRNRKIELEKEFASNTRKAEQEKELEQERGTSGSVKAMGSVSNDDDDDDIAKEAKRMAAEVLQEESGDDEAISDLFASLPVQETDAAGKTSTVINGADGIKVTIRDFGKWSGINPTRALDEACRSRYIRIVATYNNTRPLLTLSQRFGCENRIQSCIGKPLFQSAYGNRLLV